MSIKSDLKKDGIEVVDKLDTLHTNSIAKNIAKKLCHALPNMNFNESELFIKLSRLNMYLANMPEGMAEANYFYKNSSIYFNSKIPFEEIEEFAIHECIHYLQEVKDKKNNLLRMGLCDFSEFKIYGLALNEAAVQYITSKVIGIPKDTVKYYGIEFPTTSPSYYPLECNLIAQMAFITGEDILIESTFNNTTSFQKKFIELTSKETFYLVQKELDNILNLEESIIILNNKFRTIDEKNPKSDVILNKMEKAKEKISSTFIKIQNLIIEDYFDSKFNKITNLEELENYRKQLYTYRNYIGIADNYTFYNNYYVEKMSALEHKYNVLENGGFETAIVETVKTNKLLSIFNKIKNFFSKEKIHE